jgi:hypothetical protein
MRSQGPTTQEAPASHAQSNHTHITFIPNNQRTNQPTPSPSQTQHPPTHPHPHQNPFTVQDPAGAPPAAVLPHGLAAAERARPIPVPLRTLRRAHALPHLRIRAWEAPPCAVLFVFLSSLVLFRIGWLVGWASLLVLGDVSDRTGAFGGRAI